MQEWNQTPPRSFIPSELITRQQFNEQCANGRGFLSLKKDQKMFLKAYLRLAVCLTVMIALVAALSGPATAASPTRVLWTNTNGAVSLWSITSPGVYTADNYGPFTDWV